MPEGQKIPRQDDRVWQPAPERTWLEAAQDPTYHVRNWIRQNLTPSGDQRGWLPSDLLGLFSEDLASDSIGGQGPSSALGNVVGEAGKTAGIFTPKGELGKDILSIIRKLDPNIERMLGRNLIPVETPHGMEGTAPKGFQMDPETGDRYLFKMGHQAEAEVAPTAIQRLASEHAGAQAHAPVALPVRMERTHADDPILGNFGDAHSPLETDIPGSLQRVEPGSEQLWKYGVHNLPRSSRENAARLLPGEYITGVRDRHDGNYIVNADKNVLPIDMGFPFDFNDDPTNIFDVYQLMRNYSNILGGAPYKADLGRIFDEAAQRVGRAGYLPEYDKLLESYGSSAYSGLSERMEAKEFLTGRIDALNDPAIREQLWELIAKPDAPRTIRPASPSLPPSIWQREASPSSAAFAGQNTDQLLEKAQELVRNMEVNHPSPHPDRTPTGDGPDGIDESGWERAMMSAFSSPSSSPVKQKSIDSHPLAEAPVADDSLDKLFDSFASGKEWKTPEKPRSGNSPLRRLIEDAQLELANRQRRQGESLLLPEGESNSPEAIEQFQRTFSPQSRWRGEDYKAKKALSMRDKFRAKKEELGETVRPWRKDRDPEELRQARADANKRARAKKRDAKAQVLRKDMKLVTPKHDQ